MKRRAFLKLSSLTAFGSCASATDLFAANGSNATNDLLQKDNIITPPVLQNISANGVTVLWSVGKPSTGWVEFGETEALGQVANGSVGGLLPYDARVICVHLTGLKPGRKYFYRTKTAVVDFAGPYNIQRESLNKNIALYEFKTLDPAGDTASFMVWNDTHQHQVTLQKLIGHLPAYPSDFLIWNGDIFNDVASEEALIQETLFPAGQPYATTQPLMFVRGNHDIRGKYARLLSRTIETPGNNYFYTFRQGPIAFLVLDTGEDKADTTPVYAGLGDFAQFRLAQQSWLKTALAQPEFQSAPFRILLTHIPLRGSAHSEDSRLKWESLLARGRFDFAISGHTHEFAYHEPTIEQPFPLLVGGGPNPEEATFIHAQATKQSLQIQAFALDGKELGNWHMEPRSDIAS